MQTKEMLSPTLEVGDAMAPKPLVGVRLPPEVKAALEKLAKADDRSISYVINKVLAEYLRARKLIK
ncbi:MAG: ribbon-helix-helix protein, CopG family [Methylocella sp.]